MKKMQEEQKHFLALLHRPGDYSIIDISLLDISNGYRANSLQEIDSFTMTFTKEEIISSIKRANIVDNTTGNLVIQDNQKHNPLPVIDKNYYNNFDIKGYLTSKLNDKNMINSLCNKFASINSNKELNMKFKEFMKNGKIDEAIAILFSINYLELRKYMIYLIDYKKKEELEKDKLLIRDKAA